MRPHHGPQANDRPRVSVPRDLAGVLLARAARAMAPAAPWKPQRPGQVCMRTCPAAVAGFAPPLPVDLACPVAQRPRGPAGAPAAAPPIHRFQGLEPASRAPTAPRCERLRIRTPFTAIASAGHRDSACRRPGRSILQRSDAGEVRGWDRGAAVILVLPLNRWAACGLWPGVGRRCSACPPRRRMPIIDFLTEVDAFRASYQCWAMALIRLRPRGTCNRHDAQPN